NPDSSLAFQLQSKPSAIVGSRLVRAVAITAVGRLQSKAAKEDRSYRRISALAVGCWLTVVEAFIFLNRLFLFPTLRFKNFDSGLSQRDQRIPYRLGNS